MSKLVELIGMVFDRPIRGLNGRCLKEHQVN